MKYITLSIGLTLTLLQANAAIASELWQEVSYSQRSASPQSETRRYFKADTQSLKQILFRAAQEGGAELDTRIELPLATGEIKQFKLTETQVMEPALAAKYPEIKTYKIRGIQNDYLSGRVSYTAKGFSAMVFSPSETYLLDPSADGLFQTYTKSSVKPSQPFKCDVQGHDLNHPVSTVPFARRTSNRVAGSMRLYRLALAATAEYVNLMGGSKQLALSEIAKTINRVNEIYQRDLGIKLVLVANNDRIIFDGATTADPYPTLGPIGLDSLLTINQSTINSRIGASNYDIGHLFTSDFGNGIASVGSVCLDNYKAQAATAVAGSGVLGDPFDIDYVAHEIGHQFNADHSFNGTTRSCAGGNRNASTAYEPGSGSSIMGYAGLCGAENIQDRTDAHFHAGSMSQIHAYTTQGDGASCGSLQSITNNPSQPTLTASSDFTIPAQTPFMLSADATDADGDTLSYTWDQMDAGTATSYNISDPNIPETFGTDLGDNAIFRSYLPQAQSERYFPRLDSLLNNTMVIGETMPTTARAINFTLTVRDGKGGQAQDEITVNTVLSAAFEVTSDAADTTISNPTSARTVTWNVGNTNTSPINCSSVNIDLLKLNSARTTYCEERLVSNTENDGAQQVSLPDETIPVARLKVSCADHIIFDISSGDLAVNGSAVADVSCKTVIPVSLDQTSGQIDIDPNTNFPSSSSGGDSGAFSLFGLFGLFSLIAMKRRLRDQQLKD